MLMIIMTIISLIWFMCSAGLKGWFGNNFKRRLTWFTFDNKESERLLRIIERYNSGDLTVQFSKYGNNILFTKMVDATIPGLQFAESRIYVNVEDPDCTVYGWSNTESMNKHLLMRSSNNRGAINNEAYNALHELMQVLTEEPVSKKNPNWFGKRKNEDVHLS